MVSPVFQRWAPHTEYEAPVIEDGESEIIADSTPRRIIPRSASPIAPSVRRRNVRPLREVIPAPAIPVPSPVRRVRITDPTQLVNLTPSGRKFHASTCGFVQHCAPILLEFGIARQRGLMPCRACDIARLVMTTTIEVDEGCQEHLTDRHFQGYDMVRPGG